MKLTRTLALSIATAFALSAAPALTTWIDAPFAVTTAHAQALLDINSASKSDLDALPGIGSEQDDEAQ